METKAVPEQAKATPAQGRAKRQRRGLLLGLVLGAAALLWLRWDSHREIAALERSRLAVQARAIEHNLARQIAGLHAALTGARKDLAGWLDAERAQRATAQFQALCEAVPGMQTLQWLDAQGQVLASSAPVVQRMQGQEAYFEAVRQQPDATQLYISEPFKVAPERYSLNLSLALLDAAGRFDGLLVATLDTEYVNTVLGSVLYANDMWATVLTGRGTVLVANPVRPAILGLNVARPGTVFTRHLESGRQDSLLIGRSIGSSVDDRLVAVRTLRPPGLPMQQPLVLAVSRELDTIFAAWSRQNWLIGSAYAVVGLIAWLALVAQQRRRRETEARAAAESARAAEEAQRLALALHGGDLALWDAHVPTGKGTVNDRWYSMLGYEPAEISSDLDCWKSLVHPDDRERVLAANDEHLAGRTPSYEAQYRLRHRDGHWVWVLDRGRVVARAADGSPLRMVGTHMDITERVESEDRRRRSDQLLLQQLRLLEAAVSGLNDMVLITEAQPLEEPGPAIVFVNDAFTRLTGWRREEVLGRSPRFLLGAETDPAELARIDGALAAHQPVRGEIVNYDRDGRPYWVDIALTPLLDERGAMTHIVSVHRDISDRRQAESDRRTLERQLREAQKIESIGTLAGGIAHDFNNILAAILGNVALARGDLPPGHGAQVSLEQIHKASLRARSLVQQILTFSRRQPNPLEVQNLRPVLEETLALLRATLPAAVRLDTELAAEPLWMNAEATQMQQVLMNLCTNAWHALPDGRGRIEIGCAALPAGSPELAQEPDLQRGAVVHLWVRDDGSGMDEETLERIFDPFYTTKPVGQGTGLGLSVVHGIVRSHGGTVRVESQPGQGSCFHLYFPMAAAPGTSEPPERAPPESGSGRGQRVLYVDDDEVMLLMVERLLQRQGYDVVVCSNADQVLALVRADPQGIDLVVTDFNMPEASGIELARRLVALRPGMPIVITSGYVTEELRAQAKTLGVRALLHKEKTLEELPALVQRVLADGVAA